MAQYSSDNRNMMQTSNSSSSMTSQESKSYSSSVNRSSTTATNSRYNMEDSRNYGRAVDDSRYYVEDGRQPRYGDEQGRNLEIESLPDERALPPPTQSPIPIQQQSPPPSQAGQSQPPARRATFSPKKNNVRIVGGKLFHVEDDVEGPISIQFIGDHPNPGTRGYHVAKSNYIPPGKPRDGLSPTGAKVHFIA